MASGCVVVPALSRALAAGDAAEELMIIGGASLYWELRPRTSRPYLTQVDAELTGDTYFPEWAAAEWLELESCAYPADDENPYAYSFVLLERVQESA